VSIKPKEGVDKKYLSIKEQSSPQYERDKFKLEAGLSPEKEGTVKFT